MKHFLLVVITIFAVLFSGCGAEKINFPVHQAFQYKNESLNLEKNIKTLDIQLDSGSLEIYTWNKKDIKYEAKHIVRDNLPDEELEKLLTNYSIETKTEQNVLYIKINYSKKIKNPQDNLTELKLTIPRSIKSIIIKQGMGEVKIEDSFEGNVVADLDVVNAEFGDVKGRISIDCNKGNIRVNSGKLYNESNIDINNGNIFVKAECEKKSNYIYKVQNGNIDLKFPVSSNIFFNGYGVIEKNQFAGIDGDIYIVASTKMGKISVVGY